MSDNPICAFWNGEELTEENGYRIISNSEWIPNSREGPLLKVSCRPSGFDSVLARPEGSRRTLSLALEDAPELGQYHFKSTSEDYDFEVKLEFSKGPFPDATMRTIDQTSALCKAKVGDQIVVSLRKDGTSKPGRKKISGIITQIADSCGSVPELTGSNRSYSEYPIISILADISGQSSIDVGAQPMMPSIDHKLPAIGGDVGRLDVVGGSEPLDLQWEGSSDTPSLLVESVTINPGKGDSWRVTNDTLPEVEFTPLQELSVKERIDAFRLAFTKAANVSEPDDRTLLGLASKLDDDSIELKIQIRYDSSKSDTVQSRSGLIDNIQSVYYAEPNREQHQIRFTDSKLHYLLVDSHSETKHPVRIYSKAYSRHWDTELGEIRDINISIVEE